MCKLQQTPNNLYTYGLTIPTIHGTQGENPGLLAIGNRILRH